MSRTLTRPRTRAASRSYHAALHRMELLEPRTLLSSVTAFTPSDSFSLASTTYDSNGNLWVLNLDINDADGVPSVDRIVNGVIAQQILLPHNDPAALTAGLNGNLYLTDTVLHLIEKIDLSTLSSPVISDTVISNTSTTVNGTYGGPYALAVTSDNAVWFTMRDEHFDAGLNNHVDNRIGRLSSAGVVSFLNITGDDTTRAAYIAASGTTLLIGFQGADAAFGPSEPLGANQIATASFDGANITMTAPQTVSTGDAVADHYNYVSGIVAGSGGTFWYTLSNLQNSPRVTQGADRIIHAQFSSGVLQTIDSYVNPASDTLPTVTPLGLTDLHLDGFGRVWFTASATDAANPVGYLDPTSGDFTSFALPPASDNSPTSVGFLAVSSNPAIPQAWVTTSNMAFEPAALVRIIADAPAGVSFSGQASDLTGPEDVAMNNFVIATFSAPTGTYTASISWGSGPNSTGTVVDMGGNHYAVMVSSKTFLSQGTFAGLVTLKKADNSVLGTLGFTSTITDTPLTVTSYAVQPLVGRIAVASMTFTDDIDAVASTFHATISWGDGTTSSGAIVRDFTTPGRFVVLALHVFKKKGTYSVKTSITTSEIAAAVVSSTATVTYNV